MSSGSDPSNAPLSNDNSPRRSGVEDSGDDDCTNRPCDDNQMLEKNHEPIDHGQLIPHLKKLDRARI